MNRYERMFGTDWDHLDRDEAVERAYALGVLASLGESVRHELDAITTAVDSSYDRSVVELAFEEGQTEGREAGAGDSADGSTVWATLVSGEPVTDPEGGEEVQTGGRTGLPEAIDKIEALDPPDLDRTDAVDLPEFLKRD